MMLSYCFFFNDTATTEIYTLSLHDALPICSPQRLEGAAMWFRRDAVLVGSVLLAVGVFVFAVVTTLGSGETVGPAADGRQVVALNDAEDLPGLVGRRVRVDDAEVERVPADEGFWLDTGTGLVWVQLET